MSRKSSGVNGQWDIGQQFIDTTVAKTPALNNTYYEAFNISNAEIKIIKLQQTNTETDAKNVQVKLTVDGEVFESSATSMNHANLYVLQLQPATGLTIGTTISIVPIVKGKSIKLEYKVTSALGTDQAVNFSLQYNQF